MPLDLWLSIGLGAGIGVLYGALAFVSYRWALRFDGLPFMAIALGGMLVRMVVLLAVVLAVGALAAVHVAGFSVALIGVIIISLVLEVLVLLRRVRAARETRTHREDE